MNRICTVGFLVAMTLAANARAESNRPPSLEEEMTPPAGRYLQLGLNTAGNQVIFVNIDHIAREDDEVSLWEFGVEHPPRRNNGFRSIGWARRIWLDCATRDATWIGRATFYEDGGVFEFESGRNADPSPEELNILHQYACEGASPTSSSIAASRDEAAEMGMDTIREEAKSRGEQFDPDAQVDVRVNVPPQNAK